MTTHRTFTGKDVQEATAAALEALDAELEDVDIRVISPGKPGIFGLGGALAEIEVAVAGEDFADQESPTGDEDQDVPPDEGASTRNRGRRGQPRRQQSQRQQRQRQRRAPRNAARERPTRNRIERTEARNDSRRTERDSQPKAKRTPARDQEPPEELTPEIRQQLEEVTGEVLGKLIASMQVEVDAYVLDDLRDGSLVFEIEGEDAGLLIGRRGDTLRDLQTIVRLLVGRRLERRPNIIIDVEQYQDRRRNRLHSLAERAARDAARDGEQRLEPMPAEERRLIHMALAQNPDVVTESEGEGDDRHVVVKAME